MTIEQFDIAVSLKREMEHRDFMIKELQSLTSSVLNRGRMLVLVVGDQKMELDESYSSIAFSLLRIELERQRDLFKTNFENAINLESPLA